MSQTVVFVFCLSRWNPCHLNCTDPIFSDRQKYLVGSKGLWVIIETSVLVSTEGFRGRGLI